MILPKITCIAFALSLLAGCMTPPLIAAHLEPVDEANMAAVRDGLRAALDRPRLEVGPIDPAMPMTVMVLPSPLGPAEGHSLALPERFDLKVNGKTCYAVSAETGDVHALRGVTCRPGYI